MEFKARSYTAIYQNSGFAPLVSEAELQLIFGNEYLHDLRSYFIVEKDGTYRDDQTLLNGIVPEKMKTLEHAFQQGRTILIKDLENWSPAIQERCREHGGNTNVHLYLSRSEASGFNWHCDDRDVYIYMQSGEKEFELQDAKGAITSYLVKAGSRLFIPYGVLHRARATTTSSLHLSFGVWPASLTVKEEYNHFDIPLKLL